MALRTSLLFHELHLGFNSHRVSHQYSAGLDRLVPLEPVNDHFQPGLSRALLVSDDGGLRVVEARAAGDAPVDNLQERP